MSEQSTIHEDISYLRKLAESGRRGQILGGMFLVMAGTIFGVASMVSFSVRHFQIAVPGYSEYGLWICANVVFWAIWLAMVLRLRTRCKVGSNATNALFGIIWAAMAAGVMTAFCSTLLVANVLHAPVILNAYLPVIYAFYGTAWIATAALSKRQWMYLAGIGSLLAAFVMAVLTESSWQGLAMGVGLILLLALPGLKLVSDETRS